jgi:hypothetical protein
VLAAALHARCDVLVTENDKHFHPPATGGGSIEVERATGRDPGGKDW